MIDAKLLVMDKLQSGLFDNYLQKLCLLSQEKILWFLDNKKGRYWSLSANSDFEDMPICKKREKERNFFSEVTSDNTSFFFSPASQGCLVQMASHFPEIFSSGYRPNTRTVGKKYFF